MIEVSNLTAQTLTAGQAVTFDKVIHHTGSCECWNAQLPTSVKLRAGRGSIYEVQFSGNVTASAAATPVQLSISIGGSPLVETRMDATPAAAGDLWNVSTGTYIFMGCCEDLDRISVVNTGTNPVTLAPNSNLRIRRVA